MYYYFKHIFCIKSRRLIVPVEAIGLYNTSSKPLLVIETRVRPNGYFE